MPGFVIHAHPGPSGRITPAQAQVLIGRAPDQDLVIDDATVSRSHARLFWKDGALFFEDRGSKHGSWINGVQVRGEHPVGPGDALRLGSAELRLEAAVPGLPGPGGHAEGTLALPVEQLRRWIGSDSSRASLPDWPKALDLLHAVSLQMSQDQAPEVFLVDLLERLFRFLDASRGAMLLRNESGELVLLASRTKEQASGGPLNLSPTTVQAAIQGKQALLLKEPQTQPPDGPGGAERITASVMAVPLEHDGEVLGLCYFDASRARAPFTEDDLRFVASLGNLAAAKLLQHRMALSLRQAQRLDSLGVLAGGIAHDFNNLLAAILGNLNLAQDSSGPDSAARPFLDKAERAVLKAATLTRELLAYSGKGRFVVKPQDLNLVVQDLANLLNVSISKKIQLRYDLCPTIPAIEADSAQIQQVVMNLVTNASEAIGDQEGQIRLSTREQALDAQQLDSGFAGQRLAAGRYAVLEIADTGSGIDPRILGRIFEPFFSTKASGHGLGLSAMQGILKGHHAGIQLSSQPGGGTTFSLFFPALAGALQGEPPAAPEDAALRFHGRVLLADDEADVLASSSAMLAAIGFEVVTAVDGQEAVERCRLEAFDLVVLDLSMPRMDGFEAFRELRLANPELPVILYSGYTDHGSLEETLAQGRAGFLQKPFLLAELRQAVRQVIAPA